MENHAFLPLASMYVFNTWKPSLFLSVLTLLSQGLDIWWPPVFVFSVTHFLSQFGDFVVPFILAREPSDGH